MGGQDEARPRQHGGVCPHVLGVSPRPEPEATRTWRVGQSSALLVEGILKTWRVLGRGSHFALLAPEQA